MADVYIQVQSKEVIDAMTDAIKKLDSLKIPFAAIRRSWFQGNKAMFTLKGPGQFADLSEGYKETKQKRWGFVYPILKASGRLEQSLTAPTHSDAIDQEFKFSLQIGTRTPYAFFHQFGTKRMPSRPPVLEAAEQSRTGNVENRTKAWAKIIQDYVKQAHKGVK